MNNILKGLDRCTRSFCGACILISDLEVSLSLAEGLRHITFGTFEVDPQTGELWRSGFRVRLAGQPFKVLLILLEHPGEVVTREELLTRVWGSNTNVDFEQAISGAVKKIREALRDSADNPRFIETLPKRGYRFIAPVAFAGRSTDPAGDDTALHHVGHNPPPVAELPAEVGSAITFEGTGGADSAYPVLPMGSTLTPSKGRLAPAEKRTGPRAALSMLLRRWSTREICLLFIVALLLVVLVVRGSKQSFSNPPPYRVTQVTHYVALSVGAPGVERFLTLAQDGDRIITSVLVDGRSRLSAIFASTGGVQRISMPEEIASGTLADISRDGSKLLVRSNLSSASEQPLWIVPSSGGSGHRVASVLAHDATWMPESTNILYAYEDELRIIGQDESSAPYAKVQGRAFWLRWSPDGKLLRFTLMNPVTHVTSLWQLDSKDHVPRPVPEAAAAHLNACCGVWTADGAAYTFQADNNLWELADARSGSKLSQITNGPLRFTSPVAARSGSRIYFVGLEAPSGLQQFEEKRQYFEPAPAFLADANRVEYSRDGRWVAWTDLYENLWRARAADGSDKIQLTSEGTEVFLAHWSPDGSRLAIMAREHGGLWQTYLVNAAGSSPEALLKETRNTADPSWSPDGEHLVYGREPDLMGKESGPRNLQFLDLTTYKTEMVPGSEGLFSPRWSPDGRWIAALTLDQKTLMLYDVQRRLWKKLAATSAADPVWSSDSRAVYIHAFEQDGDPILRVDALDGSIHTVANLKSFHDGEAANYFFSGLTPGNEPLVQPRIGTGNLYTLDLSRASTR